MSRIDEILKHWCSQFMLDQNWPDNITIEEKLNRYIFPQLHQYFHDLEHDREYYQNRFYLMQWGFRKLFKSYGQVVEDFEQANIRFLSDELVKALKQEEQNT